jgi:hypothetical protein
LERSRRPGDPTKKQRLAFVGASLCQDFDFESVDQQWRLW